MPAPALNVAFPPPHPATTQSQQQQIHHRRARRAPRRGALDPAQQEASNPSPSPPAPTPAATASGGRGVRYRTPSSPDLLLLPTDAAKMRRYSALPNGGRQETLADRAHRYRGVLLVVLAPLALVSLVLLLMPRSPATTGVATRSGPAGADKYAVFSFRSWWWAGRCGRRKQTERGRLFAFRVASAAKWVMPLPTPLERVFLPVKHCASRILSIGRVMRTLSETV